MVQGRWSRYCYFKKGGAVRLSFLPEVEKLVSRSVMIFVNFGPGILLPNNTTWGK